MSKFEFTEDMREISGFGEEYEAGCRKMVIAGVEWLDKNKEVNPKFSHYENIYGLINEENEDAETLTKVMLDIAPDCTGAMMQACVNHVLYIHKNGRDKYMQEMRSKKAQEAQSW